MWWELTEGIQADMRVRYGTADYRGLALVQWAKVAVTAAPPLDIPPTDPVYYLGLNQSSFDFAPEIGTVLAAMGWDVTDYLPVADHLLTPDYSYPMTNHNSLLNRDNIGTLFNLYVTENYTSLLSS